MAKKDFSFGIVPVYRDPNTDQPLFLLIHHTGKSGYWGVPKGHKEGKETNIEAAKRELMEETGIAEVNIADEPALEDRYFFERDKIEYDKIATFYIGILPSQPTLELQLTEVDEAEWYDFDTAYELLTFDTLKEILKKANQWLTDNKISL
jgi:bis(5'-nucleosidyl)-tetraphosphatase